jgi:hypothetical protein
VPEATACKTAEFNFLDSAFSWDFAFAVSKPQALKQWTLDSVNSQRTIKGMGLLGFNAV